MNTPTVLSFFLTPTTMNTSEAYSMTPRAPTQRLPYSDHARSRSPSPLLTPPPLKHEGSPYARSPLPPVPEDYHHTPPSINRVLRYALKPNISFNLLLHPSTIITLPDHRRLPLSTLSEPATTPPLSRMTIVSPHFPWSITVSSPPSQKAKRFVAVSDVLVTLHRVLALPVTAAEYGNSLSEDAVLGVKAAYERRVRDIADWRAREVERCKGVTRVDFFMGRHRFLGLSRMAKDPDVFVLSVF